MNRSVTAAVFSVGLIVQACDAPQQQAGKPADQTYSATGEIAELAGNSVTINHEPVPALGWPSMTMTFKAPDSAMTAGIQKGATVEFSFRQEDSENVLTEIRPR